MSPPDSILARAQARVGTVLAQKWALDALLGVGGMAAVYAATHRNSKRAAIKVLHPELSIHRDIRERFLREGYAANQVSHRGAVTVHDDFVTEDGTAFLVMDLLQGETLDARAERNGGTLGLVEALWHVDQVLDVLEAAHEKGVIHRDLKPENIFITRERTVKILDFGVARVLRPRIGTPITESGVVLGTPAFMAPEQALGAWNEVDERTDVYALGATLFTVLTGALVHEGSTQNETIALAITRPARSLGEWLPALEPSVIALVDRALAHEKSARWQGAKAMHDALRRVFANMSSNGGPGLHSAAPQRAELGASPTLLSAGDVPRDVAMIPRSPVASGLRLRSRLLRRAIVVAGFAAVAGIAWGSLRSPGAAGRSAALPSDPAKPAETTRPPSVFELLETRIPMPPEARPRDESHAKRPGPAQPRAAAASPSIVSEAAPVDPPPPKPVQREPPQRSPEPPAPPKWDPFSSRR